MNQRVLKMKLVRPACFIFAFLFHLSLFTAKAGEMESASVNQAIRVTGTVLDEIGEPLIGVSVVVKGTTTGVLTDIDGKYAVNVPSKNAILVYSFIGFGTIEKTVGNSTNIDVTMVESSKMLGEVVVVAYGTQKKETVTGSIATVGGNVLKEVPAANITNTLAGKMPGLTVSQNKGRPGDDAAKIYIRGRGTWGDASPLIIIDGIEQERFDQLDPNEIESMSILKDASSTAVYGIRGANGVILITTKRGVEGKPRVNLSANWGLQKPVKGPEYLGSYDHMLLRRVAYDNDNKAYDANMSDEALEAFRTGSDPYRYPDVNWYDEMVGGTNNIMQQYNLNVTGGTQRIKYFVGFGYLDQDGGVNYQDLQKEYNPKAYFRRFNLRSNIDLQINKYVTLSANISGRSEEVNGVSGINGSSAETGGGTGGYYQQLLAMEPWRYNPFNPDGSLGSVSAFGSPIARAAFGGYENQKVNYYDIIGTLKADLSFITKGLSFDMSYSFNNRYGSKKIYTDGIDTYTYDPSSPILYTQITEDTPFTYSKEDHIASYRRNALQLKLAYARSFGMHRLNTILVYNQQKTTTGELSSYSITDPIPFALMGFAARAEYSYANKYLAELSMGYNGSENFAKGHRFGFFPSASLGYVISEEKFMEGINNVLPYLKLKGSIGLVGNDKGINRDSKYVRFAYLGQYKTLNNQQTWMFGTTSPTGVGGIYEERGENLNITWETALKQNIGIEGHLFKDQLLTFGFEYFFEKRKDILMEARRNPQILGQNAAIGNIGKVDNWGYEIELSHRNKIQNVEYSIRGSYSFARNKVKERDDLPYSLDYQKYAGYRVGQLRGYKVIGFYQDQEDINNSPENRLGGVIIPGDLKYFDANDDGIIDSNDQVPIGYSNVPEITYSISPSVSYKGFTLSFMLQGAANASMLFTGNAIYEFSGTAGGGQVSEIHKNYWTPDNPNPTYPSLHAEAGHSNKNPNSFLMQSANYLKLRDARLSYSLPASICKKMKMSSVDVYLSGTNLYTWTDMYNWDPETLNSNGDYFPQQRVYNVGININF